MTVAPRPSTAPSSRRRVVVGNRNAQRAACAQSAGRQCLWPSRPGRDGSLTPLAAVIGVARRRRRSPGHCLRRMPGVSSAFCSSQRSSGLAKRSMEGVKGALPTGPAACRLCNEPPGGGGGRRRFKGECVHNNSCQFSCCSSGRPAAAGIPQREPAAAAQAAPRRWRRPLEGAKRLRGASMSWPTGWLPTRGGAMRACRSLSRPTTKRIQHRIDHRRW